jgi:hypothetical protein
MTVICEVASKEEGFEPELSYGSHFFQDLVEADIFYVAVFNGQKDVIYHPERLLQYTNRLSELLPEEMLMEKVIYIAKTEGMEIYSDIITQTLLCK